MSEYERMAEMIFGYWVSQAIAAYAALSVPDHLAGGALTAAEIAQREGAPTDATFRLMRAGLAVGLLTVDEEKRSTRPRCWTRCARMHRDRFGTWPWR